MAQHGRRARIVLGTILIQHSIQSLYGTTCVCSAHLAHEQIATQNRQVCFSLCFLTLLLTEHLLVVQQVWFTFGRPLDLGTYAMTTLL